MPKLLTLMFKRNWRARLELEGFKYTMQRYENHIIINFGGKWIRPISRFMMLRLLRKSNIINIKVW